jgi:tRNA threonylcarbamoyladenosine biosynthesis protein TsaB
MVLYINTTDFNSVIFALSDGKKVWKKSYKVDPHKSHETLQKLEGFLLKSKILNSKSEIKKIVVNKGPGSYTGVRVGVTIALALGFAWNIPVQAKAKDKFKIN